MGTPAVIAASRPPAEPQRGEVLALADGIELIGEFEDSGFKEPPLLARRADGQVIQLTRLLYLVAEACDGRRDARWRRGARQRALRAARSARPTSRFLVDEKLRPLGVLALADGTTPELTKRAPLLALRHRRPLISEARRQRCRRRSFTWLHRPLVLAVVLLAVARSTSGCSASTASPAACAARSTARRCCSACSSSIVVATAFHEFGHASACRYGGARPGRDGRRASTSSGRRSTATSPTPTASTAPAGCAPTSAASTSTRSSRCSPAASTSPRARRRCCWSRSSSTSSSSSSSCRSCASTATTS